MHLNSATIARSTERQPIDRFAVGVVTDDREVSRTPDSAGTSQ